MPADREIRADFDRDTIVVYQAYNEAIADAALETGRFVPPFSFGRMTWIKPSFLWLMYRSNWGLKNGQERILAVRITRTGWEKALSLAVPTTFEPRLFKTPDDWREAMRQSVVHVQWDPERSMRGGALPHRSIQVGLSRHIIREYVDEWAKRIDDITPQVRKIYGHLQAGEAERARRLLPPERVYSVTPELERRLLLTC
jgi:hypothetical protein